MYKTVKTFDKHIARRYDDMRGSRYFKTVFGLYYDEILMPEDIARFDIEIQSKLVSMKESWDKQLKFPLKQYAYEDESLKVLVFEKSFIFYSKHFVLLPSFTLEYHDNPKCNFE